MKATCKRAVLNLVLTALLAALPAHARAQERETPKDQETRLMLFAANNGDFDAAVMQKAKTLFATQIDDCKTPGRPVRQLPTAYGELSFPPAPEGKYPYPTRGTWAEHVKTQGCGQVWTINMLAVARDGAAPLLLALLPGDTRNDPATQSGTEKIGASAIKKADAESCAADAVARYTRFLGYKHGTSAPNGTDGNEGWFEEWTYRFCQQTLPVQMAFLPNAKGSYDIKARVVPATAPDAPATKPLPPATSAPQGTSEQ